MGDGRGGKGSRELQMTTREGRLDSTGRELRPLDSGGLGERRPGRGAQLRSPKAVCERALLVPDTTGHHPRCYCYSADDEKHEGGIAQTRQRRKGETATKGPCCFDETRHGHGHGHGHAHGHAHWRPSATLKLAPVFSSTSSSVAPGCSSMSVRPPSGDVRSTSKTARSVMILDTQRAPVSGSFVCSTILGRPFCEGGTGAGEDE